MKKTLVTMALLATCVGAFAQGKITMANDSNHLLYFGTGVKGGDVAGAKVTAASTTSLLIDLYGGADAGSMILQTTTTVSASIAGGFGPLNFTSPNVAGATTGTFQVKVREVGFATAELAQAGGAYYGFSSIFTFRPSSSIAFNSIVNAGGTALSTWAAGNVALPGGGFGAISVQVVPEPSSMALAGLGAASLLIFRRRK